MSTAKAKQLVSKFKFQSPKNDAEKAAQSFLNGDTKVIGKYHVTPDALLYKTVVEDRYRIPYQSDDKPINLDTVRAVKRLKDAASLGHIVITLETDWSIEYRRLTSNVIARRLTDGNIIGNSSILDLVGRRKSFGKEVLNRNETDIQRYLAQFIPMVPFSVFQQAKLDLNSMVILERGPAETVTRKRVTGTDKKGKLKFKIETVHFTGASLFEVSGKVFLFDIDRREIKNEIFNPFLVELPVKVSTIKDAYSSLMPVIVKKAKLKGFKIERQGEWFFIKAKVTNAMLTGTKVHGLDQDASKPHWQRETMRLQAGNNSPNYAQLGFEYEGKTYVSGKVEHSGREHGDLILKDWYQVVPNTAVGSFTIVGDID